MWLWIKISLIFYNTCPDYMSKISAIRVLQLHCHNTWVSDFNFGGPVIKNTEVYIFISFPFWGIHSVQLNWYTVNRRGGGGGRGHIFFSGRGVWPWFPKCGACELILASLKEGACELKISKFRACELKISKFGGLWAENFQIWGELKFGQKLRL